MQQWRTAVTRFPPVHTILGLALLLHMVFALARLGGRSTLRMPPWELVQILLGLSIPFLLFPHMAATTLVN